MDIRIESVIPTRLGKKNSESLLVDIENERDVIDFKQNEIYAIYAHDVWSRAYLKFYRKSDGIPVFQLVDRAGFVDLSTKVRVRKIKNKNLLHNFGEIKLMIYGVGVFDSNDPEFISIFKQLFENKVSIAIFGLIEEKENFVHECYAGDLLYAFDGQYKSFREVLIRERITYPSRVRECLNQNLYRTRAEFLLNINNCHTSLVIAHDEEVHLDNAHHIEDIPLGRPHPHTNVVLNERYKIFFFLSTRSLHSEAYIYEKQRTQVNVLEQL